MMNDIALESFLRETPLFRSFSEDDLETLVAGSRVVSYEPNEFLAEFGEPALHLGVMIDGTARVSRTGDDGETVDLHTVAAGEVFNEDAMMTGGQVMADCLCTTPCRALLVPRDLFTRLVLARPEAVSRLSRIWMDRWQSLARDEDGREKLRASALARSGDPYGLALRTADPMKILVINSGSSSLKYTLFDTADPESHARGQVERIGLPGTRLTFRSTRGSMERELPTAGPAEAFAAMIASLTDPESCVLASLQEVAAVGHRGILGGEKYQETTFVDDTVVADMEAMIPLFPLHIPAVIEGIRQAGRLFPGAVQAVVFDSAFHHTMPPYAYLYGLPYEWGTEKGLRRYGYHGSSHKYASLRAAEFLHKPFNKLETIVCHLGNGASVCAVDHGRSVDISLGLSPLAGLMMGSRCGDLDPGLLLHLLRNEGMDPAELEETLHRRSGLLGMSGVSSDLREVQAAAESGNHRALLAIKTFAYQVRKTIGAYVAALDGLDVLVFTGGIGQFSPLVRSLACQGLGRMGIYLDEARNRDADGSAGVSDVAARESPVRILIVPADEERMIARETLSALERRSATTRIRSQAPMPVTIEISAHHVHLSDREVTALFGPGRTLTKLRDLSIPTAFACEETVNLVGPKGRVENVRILGPTRKETQVEIAMTEQYKLGVHPPVRESGDLDGTPGLTLEGPAGTVTIPKGVICAMRHIHMTPDDALRMGLKDKDVVRVRVPGDRELIFGDVLIRINPGFRLFMHIDTDEANAANLRTGTTGYIDGIQARR